MKKKTIALFLALVLIVGIAVGGTVAWLTATTTEVKNTFTTSDINVTLTESANLDLKMIPGYTITKDPKATVNANSEECWLFVEVTKSANFDTFMTYTVADGWTAGKGAKTEANPDGDDILTNVYYRKVEAATGSTVIAAATDFAVLKDNQVTVKDSVTKTQMNALTASTYPTLTFKVYASQLNKNATEEFTAAQAWNNVNPATT